MFAFSADALASLGSETNGTNGTNGVQEADQSLETLDDVVFALFLECRHGPIPGASTAENALASLIRAMQPSPSLAHVELLLVDGKEDAHFATYLGRTAGFGASFGANQADFYMNQNAGLWRAVPIRAKHAAAKLRAELGWHVDTPYSLARYACSVPPLRAIAGVLSDVVGAPAHCAALTARILKRALAVDSPLTHSSPWYGPSTLYIELTTASASAPNVSDAPSVSDDTAVAVDGLLHGNSETIFKMGKGPISIAMLHLTNKAMHSAHSNDAVAVRIAQKQLATALLRSLYG